MKISALNFNMFSFAPANVDNLKSNQCKNLDLKALYPQNYNNYLSFGNSTISKEIFPSEKLYELYTKKSEFEKSTKLVDVHKEYYSKLLKCNDLQEAKMYYPEFNDVKIGSYIKDNATRNKIRNAVNSSKSDINLMNSSLKLLQAYYGKAMHQTEMVGYFGLTPSKINFIIDALNIPVMKPEYLARLSKSKRDTADDTLIKTLPQWQQKTIAKTLEEVNAPNKMLRADMLGVIRRNSDYQKKLEDASFVSILMPILFDKYNNPKYKQFCFSVITDNLADKWQDDRYVNFVRKEPVEQWEKDLTDNLCSGLSDSEKKRMKVYVNSLIMAWQKQPSLNKKIFREINLRPTLKTVVEKAVNGEAITDDDEKIIKDFYKFCDKKLQRFSQILFEQQKEILTDWVEKVG